MTTRRVPRIRQLAAEAGWDSFEKFSTHYALAAKRAAAQEGNRRLASETVPRRSYDRWINAGLKTAPRDAAALVLTHMFGMPTERLFALVEDTAPAGFDFADASHAQAPGLEFDDPLDVISQARDLAASSVPETVLETSRSAIASIVARYETFGPQHLAGEVRMLRRMLHSLLRGPSAPAQRMELFRLTGQAAGLLGYMAVNAGQPDAARAYSTEAELLAAAVGDTELRMWALGTQSLALYYHGRYREADDSASAGVTLAPSNGQAIRLLVNGRARALARMGRAAEAEAAIGRALELSDRCTVPDGLTSCISFEPYSLARTLANAITAHLSLGRPAAVFGYARQVSPLVGQSQSDWSRALVGLDVATAHLVEDSPDIEQAMHLGTRALKAGSSTPITSVWKRARELYQQAEPWRGDKAVGDYAEELHQWRSRPLASQITGGAL